MQLELVGTHKQRLKNNTSSCMQNHRPPPKKKGAEKQRRAMEGIIDPLSLNVVPTYTILDYSLFDVFSRSAISNSKG